MQRTTAAYTRDDRRDPVQAMEEDYPAALKTPLRTGDVRAVCCPLGPYRNLTTLLASLCMLHPRCQVLNHAGMRVLPLEAVNFFARPDRGTVDRFIRYALYLAGGGRRGDWGGSILLAHAFQREDLRRVYARRYGAAREKDTVQVLFWKESQRITNVILESESRLERLLEADPRLRFVFPVRNPLDSAVSNFRTGHGRLIPGLKSWCVEEVLLGILRELHWFEQWRRRYPDRFLLFTQDEVGPTLFEHLDAFLGWDPDERWKKEARACCTISGGHGHGASLIAYYRRLIDAYFPEDTPLRCKLQAFAREG